MKFFFIVINTIVLHAKLGISHETDFP